MNESLNAEKNINVPYGQLAAFCRRWKIEEFALFGSVLRNDFGPESDIDVLVTFDPSAQWSLFNLAAMQLELEEMFGRPVDLVERRGLQNPFRRRAILNSLEVIYAS